MIQAIKTFSLLVARITTQEYTTEADYKIIDWRKSGLLTESFVRLGKQATIEKKYVIRKLGVLAEPEPETVKSILRRIHDL